MSPFPVRATHLEQDVVPSSLPIQSVVTGLATPLADTMKMQNLRPGHARLGE